jgi:CubicO group peptidase (beta-lactamase class C family)
VLRTARLVAAPGSRWNFARPPDHPGGVLDATTVRGDEPHLRATPFGGYGYGYQTWILPGQRRMFLLWGTRGQRIYVDPQSKLVMVNTAVHKLPLDRSPLQEMDALWSALIRQLGGERQ